MKIIDIIALTNAGWSKQEIMKMAGIESNPVPAGNPTPAGNPVPAGNPQPAEENETLSLLRNLTQMMQRNNINNMQNPAPEQPDAAEMLAKILD